MKSVLNVMSLTVSFCLIMSFTCAIGDAKEMYRYKDEKGNWGFTDNPALVPQLEKAEKRDVRSKDAAVIDDLQEKFFKKTRPRNKIEEARNATVAIKSSLGVGSGFFITADGYILTNRHVIALDRDAEVRLEKLEKKLSEARRRLAEEHKKILRMKSSLKDWKNHESYTEKRKALDEWTRDYEKRKKVFQKKRREFEDLKRKSSYPGNLKIFLVDDSEFPVSIISTSYRYDLALLKMAGYKTPFIEPIEVKKLSHGEVLYAIGSPMGLHLKHTVTSGIFSGFREFTDGRYAGVSFIQTNAQINRGNSGGPLITQEGKVVGINTWKFAGQKVEGLGFAVPVEIAIAEFESYLKRPQESDR
jgi:S1-C subfamily serine protease